MRDRVSSTVSTTWRLLRHGRGVGRPTDLDTDRPVLHTPACSVDRPRRRVRMSAGTDPTFYRSPAEAIAAPPERLAYVAAYDRAGQAKDAMAVLDCDPSSDDYGQVVGWSELPTTGNELHHSGGTPAPRPCATRATAT